MRWVVAAVLAAWTLWAHAADASRGHDLYAGRVPMSAPSSTWAAACVACHRPSGMGNFEGGLAVPPIAGPTLFHPLDRDTAHFFRASPQWRVRPAYDEASLGRLLRDGVTPDGRTVSTAMPRYRLADPDLADLTAYLRTLSATMPPGVDDRYIRIASVSTPDVPRARVDAMMATLRRFVELKNGQSRQEATRAVQAGRTREMATYRKFRIWEWEHWPLEGDPSTWSAQLQARHGKRPVFALVGGIGGADWAAVDQFCLQHRLPCLLPLVEIGAGSTDNFYALHFHAGIDSDARLAARTLLAAGHRSVELWAAGAAAGERVTRVLESEGIEVRSGAGTAVLSLQRPEDHLARLPSESRPVAWLPGTRGLGQADLVRWQSAAPAGWIISPLRVGADRDIQLRRAVIWARGQRLQELSPDVVGAALQAATVLGEGLAHVDFGFTPEYVLELLEHGLENLVPWSPYPRLAIGPDQRVASKGSWLGTWRQGRLGWEWTASP